MEKDELLFQKRILDLKKAAERRSCPVFTGFLNSNELSLLHSMPEDIPEGSFRTYGGYEFAERQIAVFLPDALFISWDYPIAVLKIRPVSRKFAENMTHRDYLGALMNLGIERSLLGDILVQDEETYVFCEEKIAPYLCDNLSQIKHTQVCVTLCSVEEIAYTPKFETITGSVSSIRLDAVLALAFRKSRSFVQEGIAGGKVFINERAALNPSQTLKAQDTISFRGYGKLIFESEGGQSKKGKTYVTIKKYI